MRNKTQIAVRVKRVGIANELLGWMNKKGYEHGRVVLPVVAEFMSSRRSADILETYEVWKAWDMMRETGRVGDARGWTVLNWAQISIDEKGDVR